MKQRTRLLHGGDDLTNYSMGISKKNDDDDVNNIQLHRVRPKENYIEAQVQEGDTLQAVSLRFHCSISELKRINHIDKDNEIYARRTIKVPVTPYSVLTELIPTLQGQEPQPSTSKHILTTSVQNNILLQNGFIQHQSNDQSKNTETNDFAIDCNTIILNSALAPSIVPYTDTDPSEQVSEDTQLLPNRDKETVETVVVKELTSHGADFGLKWFHLVCCMLILGVVIPLVYIMFYLDKHEHSDIPPLHTT